MASKIYRPTPLLYVWHWHVELEAWIPHIVRSADGRAFKVWPV